MAGGPVVVAPGEADACEASERGAVEPAVTVAASTSDDRESLGLASACGLQPIGAGSVSAGLVVGTVCALGISAVGVAVAWLADVAGAARTSNVRFSDGPKPPKLMVAAATKVTVAAAPTKQATGALRDGMLGWLHEAGGIQRRRTACRCWNNIRIRRGARPVEPAVAAGVV